MNSEDYNKKIEKLLDELIANSEERIKRGENLAVDEEFISVMDELLKKTQYRRKQ